MNKKVCSFLICLLAAGFLTAGAFADEMKKEETKQMDATPAPAMDEEMKSKWEEYSTPNENHRLLDAFVGSFNYTSKHWMSPQSPVEETSGIAAGRWIMKGRFVEQAVQGTAMGQPFNGIQTSGYDNASKEYVSTWYDDMGTGLMIAAGSYDPATKTLTQTGTFNCPFRGNMAMRWVTRFIDKDTYSFEMYGPDETGKEFKGMEIVYKKKQG